VNLAGIFNVFIVLRSHVSVIHALVATSPRWQQDSTIQRSRTEGIQYDYIVVQPKLNLRIRSTTPEDVPKVATILAHALLEENNLQYKHPQMPFNFKKQMEFLRTKHGVVSLLHSRIDVVTTGMKLWQSVTDDSPKEDDGNDRQTLRYLWSSEIFRSKLEKACKLSDEPHSWKGYNFACAPQNTNKLFHKMMTAENIVTGEIVGFGEVAMLSQPTTHWSSKEDVSYCISQREKATGKGAVPTIVNLVTLPEYRRRGIASSILRSAYRYVQLHGCDNELALYVEQQNDNAVRIYERLGFKPALECSNQLYMKAEISKTKQKTHARRQCLMTNDE
jgi:ribosomal protein S18 acetylase RimI-like enzyme